MWGRSLTAHSPGGLFPPPFDGAASYGDTTSWETDSTCRPPWTQASPAHPPLCAQARGPAPSLRGAVASLKTTGLAQNVGPRV